MIAGAIPLSWALLLWHGSIFWGSGYFPSGEECEAVKLEMLQDPMVTDAECLKPLTIPDTSDISRP